MNITHIRYAVEVARTGSISQAAENLGVGQPNLSKAIKELEGSLGVTLFRRTSKGAVSTPQGETFLQYAYALLTHIEEMQHLFTADHTSHKVLALATTPSAVVAEAVADTAARLPEEQTLSLWESDAAGVLQAVADRRASLGLLRCSAAEAEYLIRQCRDKGLYALPLRHTPRVAILSRSHPLAESRPLLEPELAAYVRLSGGEGGAESTSRLHTPPKPTHQPRVWELTDPATRLAVLSKRHDAYCLDEPLPPTLLQRYGLCTRRCVSSEEEWVELQILPEGEELREAGGILLDALSDLWRQSALAIDI